MKKSFLKILSLLFATCAISGLAACSGESDSSSSSSSAPNSEVSSSVEESSIELNATTLSLDLLEKATLVATTENLTGDFVWTSSDPTVATVSERGEVVALKEGTTNITVACGEYQAQCTVTVAASGVHPTLTLNCGEETLSLLTGATFSLVPSLTYNGTAVDKVTYTYTVSGDAVSVSNEGLITAIEAGAAVVTVQADWGAFTEYALVEIEVVADTMILCDVSEITLYSTDITGEKVSETLNVTVKVDGQMVNAPQFEVEYDHTLLSVDGLTITNIADDSAQTQITVKYVVSATETLSMSLNVNLEFVTLDCTAEKNDYRFVATETNAANSFADCFSDGAAVTKVFDASKPTENLVDAEGNLLFDAEHFGEREWIVYGNKGYACRVAGLLVTDEIETAAEFKAVFLANSVKGSSSVAAETYYGGYYELKNNIDLGSAWVASKYKCYKSGDTPISTAGVGFNGVLDGCGYTVSNFSLDGNDASLFATIGQEGQIKNIAFTDVQVSGWAGGVVAHSVFGTLENVFVAIDNSNTKWFYGNNFGVLAYAFSDATIKNCVTYLGGIMSDEMNYSANTNAFVNWNVASSSVIENCYAVYGTGIKVTNADGLTAYSVEEYQEASYSGLNSEIWDMNGFPIFKSALAEWKLSVVDTKIDVNTEIKVFASIKDYNYFELTASDGEFARDTSVGGYTYTFLASEPEKTYTINLYAFGRAVDTLELTTRKITQSETALAGTLNYAQKTWTNNAYVDNTGDLTFDTGLSQLNFAEFTVETQNGEKKSIRASITAGLLTIPASSLTALAGGDYQLAILVDNGSVINIYTIGLKLVTAEITDGIQFKTLFLRDTALAASGIASETYYDGYYVLKNNITLDGNWKANRYPVYNGAAVDNSTIGFNGTFDGQGYVVSNLVINGNDASIFGTIGVNGVVKNVAFVGMQNSGWAKGVVASDLYGTVDNVYVEGSGERWGYGNNFGAICGKAKSGAVISNCVTKWTNYHANADATYNNTTSSFVNIDEGATLVNNYTLYGGGEDGYNVKYYIYVKNDAGYEDSQLKIFTPSTYQSGVYSGLNENIWNMTGDYPKFKNHV